MALKFDSNATLILGAKGTGKTPYVIGDPVRKTPGLIHDFIMRGIPSVVFDMVYHPKYAVLPELKEIDKIPLLRQGAYYCVQPVKKDMRAALSKATQLQNAAVFLEDAFRHERVTLSDQCAALIGNCKNVGVHFYAMYHRWRYVPKEMFGIVDKLTLFKMLVPPGDREEDELGDNFGIVMDCYNRVMAHPDPHHHETISITV
jgi:hypothetical protein